MPKKRFSAEQIVVLLRQIEVLMSQGKAAPVACREAGISQQSYYRWRKEYGGLELDQAFASPSTESCATSASTGKSSTASRRQVLSSSNGASTTTPSDRTHR